MDDFPLKYENFPIMYEIRGNIPQNSMRDEYLEQLAIEYHENVDAYDKIHKEYYLQSKNAYKELKIVKKIGHERGYTENEIREAIAKYKTHK